MSSVNVRPDCLLPGNRYTQPTDQEVREILRVAGLSASEAANALGLGGGGGRTVRRWRSGETHIPYPAWALLCEMAGLGLIWKENQI